MFRMMTFPKWNWWIIVLAVVTLGFWASVAKLALMGR